jgi:hypothetical protein
MAAPWYLSVTPDRTQSFWPAALTIPLNSEEMNMFDYSTDFDPAPTTSGPWLRFYAKPSPDGAIPAGAWALRDAGNTTLLDLSKGFVLDWPAARTFWAQGQGIPGVAPVRQWNASRARFEPRPPGDNWHKGFLAPVAYAPDAAATWDQWGAGVWIGFSEMFIELMERASTELPNLPLLIPVSTKPIKFAHGPSLIPKFKVSRYVRRPACLPESAASPPQIAAQPPQQRAQVTYSHPSAQASAAQPGPLHPPPPTRPALVQPADWDEPVQDLATPATRDVSGKVVPIPGQEPPRSQPDALNDDEMPF